MRVAIGAYSLLLISAAFATTNEDIRFLDNVRTEAKHYSPAELKMWNLGADRARAAVPESADHRNLEHMRLLVAANPDRYEGYVMYGLHFFIEKRWDVAVAAYDKAVEIIRLDKITNTVSFSQYYDASLLGLFAQERQKDKSHALKTFEKLVTYDFTVFDREPKLAPYLSLVVMDYYTLNDSAACRALIQRAQSLTNLPPDVSATLAQMLERIANKGEHAGAD